VKLPKPGKPHEKLQRLSGEWDGKETWHPSQFAPEGAEAEGAFEFRKDVDGFYLLADYEDSIAGKPNLRGHGVLGWDPKQESYTLHWFDNFGSPPAEPSRGDWQGDRLVLENGSGDHRGRTIFALKGDDAFEFGIEMSEDGGKSWSSTLDGDYHRR